MQGFQEREKICNFCGKKHSDVALVVASPSAYICDECILVGVEIIAEKARLRMAEIVNMEREQADG